jgi:tetratricopeptide (TPR) repeat protein
VLRGALTIEANSAKIHRHLGAALIDQNRGEEAAAAKRALESDNHDVVNLMGRIAFDRGDLPAALTHFRRALALKPDLADAYNNMGSALKELGRLKEAEQPFLKALELDPKITGVYVNLADLRTFTAEDTHLAAMQALERDERLSPKDQMHLHFALGKAYADLKDHGRAFAYMRQGNVQDACWRCATRT